MERYDVLVVGAGPGGSSAAKKCVDGGLKTLLIDRKKLPRKKACSGIVTNVSQNYVFQNFGPIPESVYGKPYISKGMAMHFPKHGTVFADVDCYSLYVWRDRFDYFLASNSGAKVQDETSFLKFDEVNGEYEVTLKLKGKRSKFRAKYIVGADGGYSRVTKWIAPDVFSNQYRVWACQKYYEGTVDASQYYLYWIMEKGFGPMPFMEIKDGQIIIGFAHTAGTRFNEMYQKYLEYLKREFNLKIKREIHVEGCYANLGTPINYFFPGRGKTLMVGDAFGFVNQGHCSISSALVSGGLAGQAIIENINGGADALQKYRELVRPEVENTFDQFNPFYMRNTAGSDASRQPSFFNGVTFSKKMSMINEALGFLKTEWGPYTGFLPQILNNIARRAILRRYKPNMVA